jgi:hypothetical protein
MRSYPLDEDCVTGMDVPTEPWTAEDVAFWTGTARYQPWKDIAAFFRGVARAKDAEKA